MTAPEPTRCSFCLAALAVVEVRGPAGPGDWDPRWRPACVPCGDAVYTGKPLGAVGPALHVDHPARGD